MACIFSMDNLYLAGTTLCCSGICWLTLGTSCQKQAKAVHAGIWEFPPNMAVSISPSRTGTKVYNHSGADPGGGGPGGPGGPGPPPPPFFGGGGGGSPNFIKRGKTSRACTQIHRVLVLNSYPNPPSAFRNPVSAPDYYNLRKHCPLGPPHFPGSGYTTDSGDATLPINLGIRAHDHHIHQGVLL